jgi:hypothetical protein
MPRFRVRAKDASAGHRVASGGVRVPSPSRFSGPTERSVGVTSELIRADIYFWGPLMAGAVLGSVPIVALYVFFLDYYVSGLTAGAVK